MQFYVILCNFYIKKGMSYDKEKSQINSYQIFQTSCRIVSSSKIATAHIIFFSISDEFFWP